MEACLRGRRGGGRRQEAGWDTVEEKRKGRRVEEKKLGHPGSRGDCGHTVDGRVTEVTVGGGEIAANRQMSIMLNYAHQDAVEGYEPLHCGGP